MKKRGFTLVELLAVTVILAIISFIVIPGILKLINKAREDALKETVNGYIESVHNALAVVSLKENKKGINETCNLKKKTMVCSKDFSFDITVKGEKLDEFVVTLNEYGTVQRAQFRKNKYCGRYLKDSGIDFFACDPRVDASEVSYTPSDSSWKVTNVEEALNELSK